jgi:putative ABC transport system substrate-binding protein
MAPIFTAGRRDTSIRSLKAPDQPDLPMEGPPKFELIANLKTAQTLSLTIPSAILARADQKID